jgi:hypothetical protein
MSGFFDNTADDDAIDRQHNNRSKEQIAKDSENDRNKLISGIIVLIIGAILIILYKTVSMFDNSIVIGIGYALSSIGGFLIILSSLNYI